MKELNEIREDDELFPDLTKLFEPTDYGYSSVDIVDINKRGNCIFIAGNGRWNAPSNYIISLVNKFNLSGTYFDLEAGCDFSHKLEFKNGNVIKEIEDTFFSQLSVDYHGLEYFRYCTFENYLDDTDIDYIINNNLSVAEINKLLI